MACIEGFDVSAHGSVQMEDGKNVWSVVKGDSAA